MDSVYSGISSKVCSTQWRDRKRDEFEGLQQDGMLVTDCGGKFHALARDDSMILHIGVERVKKIVKGFIISIPLGFFHITAVGVPFQKVVDIAKEMEMIQHEGKRARY